MSVVPNINNLNKQERGREREREGWRENEIVVIKRPSARTDNYETESGIRSENLPVCRNIPGDTHTGPSHGYTRLRCNIHISDGSPARMSQQDRD